MKRTAKITTLKNFEPFTDAECVVLQKAIGTFSTGGHPAPDKSNLGGFGKTWVTGLLKKSEKLLAEKPEHKNDLEIVRQLIARLSSKRGGKRYE